MRAQVPRLADTSHPLLSRCFFSACSRSALSPRKLGSKSKHELLPRERGSGDTQVAAPHVSSFRQTFQTTDHPLRSRTRHIFPNKMNSPTAAVKVRVDRPIVRGVTLKSDSRAGRRTPLAKKGVRKDPKRRVFLLAPLPAGCTAVLAVSRPLVHSNKRYDARRVALAGVRRGHPGLHHGRVLGVSVEHPGVWFSRPIIMSRATHRRCC